jgi:hypothetical protein
MTRFADLLRALASGGSEFIVVGGVAAAAHGSPRSTVDLDVVYSRETRNVQAIVQALAPYHPYLREAPPGLPFRFDFATVSAGLNFTLTTDLGWIGLLGEIPGGGRYEDLLPHSITAEAFGMLPHSRHRNADSHEAGSRTRERPGRRGRTRSPARAPAALVLAHASATAPAQIRMEQRRDPLGAASVLGGWAFSPRGASAPLSRRDSTGCPEAVHLQGVSDERRFSVRRRTSVRRLRGAESPGLHGLAAPAPPASS